MAKLVQWTPTTTTRMLDRFFDEFARTVVTDGTRRPNIGIPALDVIDHNDHLLVHMDLPGVAPENVNIEIKDGVLTIATQVSSDETHESENYAYRERYQGAYQRSLRLPKDIDVNNTEAAFENGVLTLRMPRLPEASPLRIPVKGVSVSNN